MKYVIVFAVRSSGDMRIVCVVREWWVDIGPRLDTPSVYVLVIKRVALPIQNRCFDCLHAYQVGMEGVVGRDVWEEDFVDEIEEFGV